MNRIKLIIFFIIGLAIFNWSCNKDDDNTINTDVVSLEENEVDATEMLKLVNEVRAKGCKCGEETMPPVSALKWNSNLEKAALKHSKDMALNNNFSHTGTDGSTAGERIKETGYVYTSYGENIAAGLSYSKEEAVVDAWIKSPGHCKNMMKAGFTELGAAKYSVDKNYQVYWTQVFATPQSSN